PILGADRSQSAAKPFANGFKLPLSITAVDFAHHHRGLGGIVLTEVIAEHVGLSTRINKFHARAVDLAKGLSTRIRIIDGHNRSNSSDIRRDASEVDLDAFALTSPSTI